MGGYSGKILRVELTTKQVNIEPLNMELARSYLSGRGLAGRILTDEVSSNADALSPENKLLFATGVLTGTGIPTSRRFMAVTKSPVHGRLAFSNFGGHWGAQLKFAGYDVVILEGKAAHPVYIVIRDSFVEIRDATHVWGKDVFTAMDTIKQEIGDLSAKTLTIGPAGENLSLMAVLVDDFHHAAGRNGVGAVMGSKNVKALMVRGTRRVGVADPVDLKRVLDGTFKTMTRAINRRGKNDDCYRCPFICEHHSGKEKGEDAGPNHKCSGVFSSDSGIYDDEAAQEAYDLCNQLGLDQISVSSAIATGIELTRRGYIRPGELDSITLEHGNSEGILEWIHKIAYKEGFGISLGLGSYHLAKSYNALDISETLNNRKTPQARKGERNQPLSAVIDSIGLCIFTSGVLSLTNYTELINAVIGSKYTNEELLNCGELICNNERFYNLYAEGADERSERNGMVHLNY